MDGRRVDKVLVTPLSYARGQRAALSSKGVDAVRGIESSVPRSSAIRSTPDDRHADG